MTKAQLTQSGLGRWVLVPLWLLVTGKWSVLQHWIQRVWFRKSIFIQEWEMGMCSLRPEAALGEVMRSLKPASVLDVGCGCGRSLEYFVERGVDAHGVEGSALAISRARYADRIRRHDLEKPLDLGRRFEVVWSFEVAEHIRPERVEVFLETLVRHADVVVVSAAPPGQGGDGHFNEQPRNYWISRFQSRGYAIDEALSTRLAQSGDTHAENLMVFRRV